MKKTAGIATFLFLTCVVSLLAAKKPWEKPFEEWSQQETLKVLTDSPWAKQYTQAIPIISRDSGVTGEKDIFQQYTVRFFSALPVREAYVRMLQLMNNYADLPEQQKEAFDQKFGRALSLEMDDQIVVAVEFDSNDRQLKLQIDRFFKTAKTDLLKQSAYLITKSHGRIELMEYFPPSPDGTGAKFVFPRQIEGEPVVSEADKEVKFQLQVPDTGKVNVSRKTKQMVYRGKLEI